MEYDQQRPKRSRFDVTEPERVTKSRFDVDVRSRSRSPTSGGDGGEQSGRSRSPLTNRAEDGGEQKKDAATIAAEKAAAINAALKAKKSIQHADVHPVRKSSSADAGAAKAEVEIYQQDGDYIKDIEINDLHNRYMLTKGSYQKDIKENTGADVTTRGNFYPDKSLATPTAPPLYLHVTSTTKEGLDAAVKMIDETMSKPLPNLVDERRFRTRREEAPPVERDSLGRRKWPEEIIPIDLEPIPGFNLRAQVVGQGGTNVKYIQSETRARVQIKGQGSGYIEHETQRESDERMYLSVASPDPAMLELAKKQCIELLEHVKSNYEEHKSRGSRPSRPPPESYSHTGPDHQRSYSPGDASLFSPGLAAGYPPRPGDNGQQGSPYAAQDQYGAGAFRGGQQSPTPMSYAPGYNGGYSASAASTPVAAAQPTASSAPQTMTKEVYEVWCTYYAQNPDQDPYAQYGGFAQYAASFVQAPAAPPPPPPSYGYGPPPGYVGANASDAPPPPPPSSDSVPPPPPPGW